MTPQDRKVPKFVNAERAKDFVIGGACGVLGALVMYVSVFLQGGIFCQ